jgi:hypothetical protein
MMNWLKLILLLASVLLHGCANVDPSSLAGHYEVRVDTAMFRYGPAQSFGPDFSLKQGTHVVMMRRDFGYSRVMTDEGQTGYVATEDLIPMAAPKLAAGRGSNGNNYPGLPPQWQGRTVTPSDGRGGRFSGPVLPSGALFGPGELPPLPERGGPAIPDNPQEPKPEFRHLKPKPNFRINVPTPAPPPTAPPEEAKTPKFR